MKHILKHLQSFVFAVMVPLMISGVDSKAPTPAPAPVVAAPAPAPAPVVTAPVAKTAPAAQAPATISGKQIEDNVKNTMEKMQKEIDALQAENSSSDNAIEIPTQLCRDHLATQNKACGADAECQKKALGDFRYCVTQVLKTLPQQDPALVVSRATKAFGNAKTMNDCTSALNLRLHCVLDKECHKKIVDMFDSCGKKFTTESSQGASSTEVIQKTDRAKEVTLMSANDLKAIQEKAEIAQIKARIRSLEVEIKRYETQKNLVKEGHKGKRIADDYATTKEKQKVTKHKLNRKNLDAAVKRLTEDASGYLKVAQGMNDYQKLPIVLESREKVVNLLKKIQENYVVWLKESGEKIPEVEALPTEINKVLAGFDEQIRKLQQAKASMDAKDLAKIDVASTLKGYKEAIKTMKEGGLKSADRSEMERTLENMTQMQKQANNSYAQFRSKYNNESIPDADQHQKDIEGYIAQVKNAKDGIATPTAPAPAPASAPVAPVSAPVVDDIITKTAPDSLTPSAFKFVTSVPNQPAPANALRDPKGSHVCAFVYDRRSADPAQYQIPVGHVLENKKCVSEAWGLQTIDEGKWAYVTAPAGSWMPYDQVTPDILNNKDRTPKFAQMKGSNAVMAVAAIGDPNNDKSYVASKSHLDGFAWGAVADGKQPQNTNDRKRIRLYVPGASATPVVDDIITKTAADSLTPSAFKFVTSVPNQPAPANAIKDLGDRHVCAFVYDRRSADPAQYQIPVGHVLKNTKQCVSEACGVQTVEEGKWAYVTASSGAWLPYDQVTPDILNNKDRTPKFAQMKGSNWAMAVATIDGIASKSHLDGSSWGAAVDGKQPQNTNDRKRIRLYVPGASAPAAVPAPQPNVDGKKAELIQHMKTIASTVNQLAADALRNQDANFVAGQQKRINDILAQARQDYNTTWMNTYKVKVPEVEDIIEKQISAKNNEVLAYLGKMKPGNR